MIMMTSTKIKAHSIEEVEGTLLLLAYLIERDGDGYLPLYEKIETHLLELQRQEATRDRARRLLHSYSRSGHGNEIRSKNFSLSSKVGPLPYLGLPDR
ncbi:MAG: hypothetical protein QOF85_2625 [Solirubrobacterales bacterium]|nr:hypothetical protein [Solirubrobacterales bacterium]